MAWISPTPTVGKSPWGTKHSRAALLAVEGPQAIRALYFAGVILLHASCVHGTLLMDMVCDFVVQSTCNDDGQPDLVWWLADARSYP